MRSKRLMLALVPLVLVSLGWSMPVVADNGWRWPLAPQPRVVHPFDAPAAPYAPGHRGVDLEGRAGQRLLAVTDGTVSFAGSVAGIGVVSIDTAQGRVTYQPVAPSVRRGEAVRSGQPLGRLATTGGHCLPQVCLHLGLIVDGEYRDPLALLGGGPVRLLPVDGPLTSVVGPLPGRGVEDPRIEGPSAFPLPSAAVTSPPPWTAVTPSPPWTAGWSPMSDLSATFAAASALLYRPGERLASSVATGCSRPVLRLGGEQDGTPDAAARC